MFKWKPTNTTNTRTDNHDTAKPKGRKRRILRFYTIQTFKASLVLLLGFTPLDVATSYVHNVALVMSDISAEESLIYSSNMNLYNTMASGVFVLSLYLIICKINWRYVDKETKTNAS